MQTVDDILEVLQPVAWNDLRPATADARVVGLERLAESEIVEHVDARQERLPIGRAEVREDQAVSLLERIPRLAHVALDRTALGLARLIEAVAVDRRTSSRDSSSGCRRASTRP